MPRNRVAAIVLMSALASSAVAHAADCHEISFDEWHGTALEGPWVAHSGGHGIVVWRDPAGPKVTATEGTARQTHALPNLLPRALAAGRDGHVLIFVDTALQVAALPLELDGRTRGAPVSLGTAGSIYAQPTIIAEGDGYVVAWSRGDVSDNRQAIVVARLDGRGALVAGPEVIATVPRHEPPRVALATDAGVTWLAWHELVQPEIEHAIPEVSERVHAVRLAPGRAATDDTPFLVGPGGLAGLASRNGTFVALLDGGTVGQLVFAPLDGQPTEGRRHVIPGGNAFGALAPDADGFVLLSISHGSGSYPRGGGATLLRLTADGMPRGPATRVDGVNDASMSADGQALAMVRDLPAQKTGVSRLEIDPLDGSPSTVVVETKLKLEPVTRCEETSETGCTVAPGTRPGSGSALLILALCALAAAITCRWTRSAQRGEKPRTCDHHR